MAVESLTARKKRLAAYGEPVEGTPFGRYRLIELLGRGGMGEVWRAHDTDTDRVVAIKLLPASLSDDEDFQRRFRREAHAAARLSNPHVIPIHHYGEIDGRLYVDMRLIEGRDLGTALADGPLEPGRAVRIIDQVAKALHAAHQAGLLHRDIKPSNILLDGDDFAYLIDFGIARAADETRMTKSGNTIGTFAYIAPERLDSTAEEDARADIYSLACVLYESLTGDPPFAGTTVAHLIAAHLNAPPPRPSITQPSVPAQFDPVIATGMAKDPDHRYQTAVELAASAKAAITQPMPVPGGIEPSVADKSASRTTQARSKTPRAKADPQARSKTPRAKADPQARDEVLVNADNTFGKPAAADAKRRRERLGTVFVASLALLVIGSLIFIIGNLLFSDQQTAISTPTPTPPMWTAHSQPRPPSATIQAPLPPRTSTTMATTAPPTPPAGAAVGLPCSASDHGQLARDPHTGLEIFCHADVTGDGTWDALPSDVNGNYVMGTACADLQIGDKRLFARSTNGYLIACEPASYAGPVGGAELIWQRYRAIFGPGT